ncbi:hypothetical protein, partial [Candidatus Erwinia dacicola]|uniref:hypothetical protein n=1 Tax=Candidatus Erwinia dacicola TaxID=252393 RepID=UPI001C9D328A
QDFVLPQAVMARLFCTRRQKNGNVYGVFYLVTGGSTLLRHQSPQKRKLLRFASGLKKLAKTNRV